VEDFESSADNSQEPNDKRADPGRKRDIAQNDYTSQQQDDAKKNPEPTWRVSTIRCRSVLSHLASRASGIRGPCTRRSDGPIWEGYSCRSCHPS
jgi:hypothetical protein